MMSKISKSPNRNSFQKEKFLERRAEEGRTPDNDPDTQSMVDYYESWNVSAAEQEADPEWQRNNMEYDMRSTDWFLAKARAREGYAQNVYAAICNNDFQKLDVILILKEETWGASWRSAGGIVANMRQEGDYINWYCSGIGDGLGNGDADRTKGYVPEGYVTDEIRSDLQRLGWVLVPGGDWENFEKE